MTDSEDNKLYQSLGRIEGMLAGVQESQRKAADDFQKHLVADAKMHHDINERFGKVENRQHWFLGAATIAGASVAAVWEWFRSGGQTGG